MVCIPDQIQKMADTFHGSAEIGEISRVQARPWVILREAIHDFVVYVKGDVHTVTVLNDEKLLLDFRFIDVFMTLNATEYFGIRNEEVVYAVWDLYVVDPLELTLK